MDADLSGEGVKRMESRAWGFAELSGMPYTAFLRCALYEKKAYAFSILLLGGRILQTEGVQKAAPFGNGFYALRGQRHGRPPEPASCGGSALLRDFLVQARCASLPAKVQGAGYSTNRVQS